MLPGGDLPPDGKTRFDWRQRSLSRKYVDGSRRLYTLKANQWFDRFPNRVDLPPVELDITTPLGQAIERYKNKFIPLVEIERDEAQRQFESRLHEWSIDRLIREGFMLEEMGASIQTNSHLKWLKPNEFMVTFTLIGKQATKSILLYHKFAKGTAVMISRTDPLIDPVVLDGTVEHITKPESDAVQDVKGIKDDEVIEKPIERLIGRVDNVGKASIRVKFALSPRPGLNRPAINDEETVEGLIRKFVKMAAKGKWRIDVAFDEYPFLKQIQAIQKLDFDPVLQDISGFPNDGVVKNRDEIDQAMNALLKQQRPTEQQILKGTSLRHLILNSFQCDSTPPDVNTFSSSPESHRLSLDSGSTLVPQSKQNQNQVKVIPGAPAHAITPSDIDATLSPGKHMSNAPRGVLARNQLIQSWTRRYRTPEGVEPLVVEGDPVVPLNPTQKRAMAMMLSERLSLVQGPPGTGKTRVIVEMIKLLKKHWEVPHPVLVCAHTNVAVDNLVDGLVGQGLKVLRLGSGVREDLRGWTLDERIQSHPKWINEIEPLMEKKEMNQAKKIKLEQQIYETSQWGAELSSNKSLEDLKKDIESIQAEVKKINGRIFPLTRFVQREVIIDADVICATCLTAASSMFEQFIDFPFVFLDEASMATEPLSMVPLMRGSSQVAIIGDHKQLPPVILSDAAKNGGLGVSMFERLIHEHDIPSIMLDTQYRMHPSISAFSSKTFYNSQLKDGTVDLFGSVRPGLEPPETAFLVKDEQGKSMNVTFIDHDRFETAKNRSVANIFEVELVWDIIHDLLYKNPELRGKDIGVVAPYAAQISEIKGYLDHDDRYSRICESLGQERVQETEQIEVKTVDGFEGREKEVIIFSCTRSNPGGYIGFLGDWRRLNVGITRAKRALIIVGSSKTLKQAKMSGQTTNSVPRGGSLVWRKFIKYLEENRMVLCAFDVDDEEDVVQERERVGRGWRGEDDLSWEEDEWVEEEKAFAEVLG